MKLLIVLLGELLRRETQYKSFKEYRIKELSTEINRVRINEILQEKNNSIYIPNMGKLPVVSKLTDTKLKHHYYFQVVLNNLAINEYVSFFFKSNLGELILDSLASVTAIRQLKKIDIEQVSIALPSMEEQFIIVRTQKKLATLF